MYKTLLISDMAHGVNDIYVHNPVYGNTINPILLNRIGGYFRTQYPLVINQKIYIIGEGVEKFHQINIDNTDFGIDAETNAPEGLLLRLLDGLRGVLLVPQIRPRIYGACLYVIRYSNFYGLSEINQEIKDNVRRFIEIFSDPNFESYRGNAQRYSEPFIIFQDLCINIKKYLQRIIPGNQRVEMLTRIIVEYQYIMVQIINANKDIISDEELNNKNNELYGLTLRLRDSYVSDRIYAAQRQNLLTCVIMGGNHTEGLKQFIGYGNIGELNEQFGGYKVKYLKYKQKYLELKNKF